MKRIVGIIFFIVTILAIHHDLTKGTLAISEKVVKINHELDSLEYFEKRVSRGDTLISIMESAQHPLRVPISTVINDFRQLNNDILPEQMQDGKIYKFPIYEQD